MYFGAVCGAVFRVTPIEMYFTVISINYLYLRFTRDIHEYDTGNAVWNFRHLGQAVVRTSFASVCH